MDDGVEALEVAALDVAQVAAQRRERAQPAVVPESRRREEAGVEAHDLVSGVGEERRQHGADVALVTGDQDPHRRLHSPAQIFHGGEPLFHRSFRCR